MAKSMTEALRSDNEAKLAYVETQIEEMKAIIRRNEVDNYINDNGDWNEAEQEAADERTKTIVKENIKLNKAIVALEQLKAKLEK